jgi:hypothetical protein
MPDLVCERLRLSTSVRSAPEQIDESFLPMIASPADIRSPRDLTQ